MKILRFLHPKSVSPDDYRRELILNVILGFCIAITFLFFLMVLNNALRHQSRIGLLNFLMIASPIGAAYVLSRKGRIFAASCVTIAFFSFGLLYSAYVWGAILPTVLLGIAFISTCTSLLINSRSGFIYALSGSAIVFALELMRQYGIHSPDYSWTSIAPDGMDIIEYSILILFISGISWLSNRQTESALIRARSSERDLAAERDGLEAKVIERTKELEQSQIERTTEMYRFVEFGKLSAGLIHDLMSPLTALCMDRGRDSASVRNAPSDPSSIDAIVGASRKIQDIINATRNQIRMDFATERMQIARSIDESLLLHQSRIKKSGIIVRKSIPASLYINGSPSLFSHVLTNLISNAIDALESKRERDREQRLDIQAKSGTEDGKDSRLTLEIHAISQPTQIKILVRDNGIGIPEHIRGSIFDPFFTTKRHAGWGYGLSASRHILQKHFGGSISLEPYGISAGTERKTTFVIRIPINVG